MKRFGALALFAICALVPAAAQAADNNPDEPGMVGKCKSGQTDYSTDMAKVTKYPDGGSTYTYGYGNEGETYTIGQPPPGFRPEKASDEELERYSFPPRPTDVGGKGWTEESLSEWEDLVRATRKRHRLLLAKVQVRPIPPMKIQLSLHLPPEGGQAISRSPFSPTPKSAWWQP